MVEVAGEQTAMAGRGQAGSVIGITVKRVRKRSLYQAAGKAVTGKVGNGWSGRKEYAGEP